MAFETSYEVLTRELVEDVRHAGGAMYVFLTSFGPRKGLVRELKNDPAALHREIRRLLNTGVDGIMTDFPITVGAIVREWRKG